MEKNNKSLKTKITITTITLLIIIGIITSLTLKTNKNNNPIQEGKNGYYIENYNDNDYYIIKDDYSGEYDIQYLYLDYDSSYDSFEKQTTMNYREYTKYCKKWNLEQKYTNKNWNYVVFSYASVGSNILEARLAGIEYTDSNTTLYIWDEASGVVASTAAYVIIVPTEKTIIKPNVEIQNVYDIKDYDTIIGKSPIERVNYTYEDNKIIAKKAYIYTKNEKINEIFNKMLDSITQKHSMTISNENKETLEIVDFISSAAVIEGSDNSKNSYIAYGETYGKTYWYSESEDLYEFDYGLERDKMIYNIALIYDWNLVLNLSVPLINPYYDSNLDTTNFKYTLEENEDNYIITLNGTNKFLEKRTDTYYINKNTYLLEKTNYTTEYWSDTYFYTYSDYIVTIPEEVIRNSEQEISIDEKPIIYLYPTKNIELSIKLGNEDKITCSYPQYTNGWNILAKTTGELIDLNTNRSLYALYYESNVVSNFKIQKDGFIVKNTEAAKFLEEKLEILGLNEREAEEFIIYWLPKLQENKYNYIRFASTEEINQNMPLIFSVEPDTIIRVLMTYKGLDKPIDIEEQKLETPKRVGFTIVEWGGSEIK